MADANNTLSALHMIRIYHKDLFEDNAETHFLIKSLAQILANCCLVIQELQIRENYCPSPICAAQGYSTSLNVRVILPVK